MSDEPGLTFDELRARISSAARERFRRGEAVVGGKWWAIDPALNYIAASGVLVRASEAQGTFGPLALPAVYLQRHAVELTLKDLCRVAHSALDTLGESLPRPNFDANHRLDTWLERLETALGPVGPVLPASATSVVDAMKDIGDTDGQSWRYGRVNEKGVGMSAFPKEQTLPIRDLQVLVEALGRDAFGDGPGGNGLFWDLGAIAEDPNMRELLRGPA